MTDEENEELTKRLREERQESLAIDHKLGFEAGEEWAKEAHHDQIMFFVQDDWEERQRLELSLRDVIRQTPWMESAFRYETDWDPSSSPTDWDEFWDGFDDGVLSVWNEVAPEVMR